MTGACQCRCSAHRRAGRRTVSGEDVEEVKEQRVFHVAHIVCPSLLEGSAVDDPSLAFEKDIRGRVLAIRGGTD